MAGENKLSNDRFFVYAAIAIFILAFAIRLITLAVTWHGAESAGIYEDADIAVNLYKGCGFSLNYGIYRDGFPDTPRPTALKAPLYPLVIFGAFKLFGFGNYFAVAMINIIASALTPFFICLSLNRVNRVMAIVTGVVIAFYPAFIFQATAKIENTPIVLMLLAVYIYLMTAKWREENFGGTALAGFTVALIMLCEPVLFPPCFLAFFVSLMVEKKPGRIGRALVFLIAISIPYSVYLYRNYTVFGEFTAKSALGYNLFVGLKENDLMPKEVETEIIEGLKKMRAENATETQEDKFAAERIFRLYYEQPAILIKNFAANMKSLWWMTKYYEQNLTGKFIVLRQIPHIIAVILGTLAFVIFVRDYATARFDAPELFKINALLALVAMTSSLVYGATVAYNLRFFFPTELLMLSNMNYLFFMRRLRRL